MPKLPKVSGEQMIKLLEMNGYSVIKTRGSHVRLYPSSLNQKKVTVPLHKELKPGTLRHIMRDANLSVADLAQ